jgi:hypothetical protein
MRPCNTTELRQPTKLHGSDNVFSQTEDPHVVIVCFWDLPAACDLAVISVKIKCPTQRSFSCRVLPLISSAMMHFKQVL